MSNTILPDEHMSNPASTRSFGGESYSFRQFVDGLNREVPSAEVILLTTLPRGGLQITQPQKVSDSFMKSYVREWHTEDDASWKAITTGKPTKGKPDSRFVHDFLVPFGYQHVAACPVAEPVLPGYVGALQVLRTAEQGAFTSQELEKLDEAAARLSTSLKDVRTARSVMQSSYSVDTQPTDVRQFVLNEMGEVLGYKPAFDRLDESIREQLMREATRRCQSIQGQAITTDRLLLPDSKGDHWVVNASAFPKYHAIYPGPVVFFSILPSCTDWAMVRASDFQADAEMARLVPAMKFMLQEYHRGPTLTEIAKTVHLSPFHFHRRFSELFGLTPKHFLLECQIHDAKGELLSGEKELAKIAADCGFAHQSHFTSRFKQATGLTPTRWRRMAHTRAM
jgi:AraC-like DNA-binding protein